MTNLFLSNKRFSTPAWLVEKQSRRQFLKSAAGASATLGMTKIALAIPASNEKQYLSALQQPLWQTLDAVLNHLLPSSVSGPGAKEIQATYYLYQLVHEQPTDKGEIEFVYQGVEWLNGYSDNHYSKPFMQLSSQEKERVLKGISRSQAGSNWLNMLILDIYEAMLSPPAYGGNPDGIGWQWLAHQAGFPLPKAGQRYYELPPRSRVVGQAQASIIRTHDITAKRTVNAKGDRKA
ncbi:gluconate 2-dehydrogenase subunit 3 family protein [Thalassotalea sp. G2M2-11]|uniref:gluconate 2-dehydrogenase subunit 3 family protein n=1 Tax=Thalassotalea sp. G2M2-11 TaxID=2787627 RepID=UPI0019D2DAB2|nr:gluconate 2-dehydrogenase subunit 3 family protein [Thalassotalea sp. G2M2-11]